MCDGRRDAAAFPPLCLGRPGGAPIAGMTCDIGARFIYDALPGRVTYIMKESGLNDSCRAARRGMRPGARGAWRFRGEFRKALAELTGELYNT